MPKINYKFFRYLWNQVIEHFETTESSSYSTKSFIEKTSFSSSEVEAILSKIKVQDELTLPKNDIKVSTSSIQKIETYLNIGAITELHDSFLAYNKNSYDEIGFLGRHDELAILSNFIRSEKKIFALYGVPLIGKTALINQFLNIDEEIQNYKLLRVAINPPPENAQTQIFNHVFKPFETNDFSDITTNTLIILENVEHLLQWKGDFENLHAFKKEYNRLEDFFLNLLKNPHCKLILESRFQINFKEIGLPKQQIALLPGTQLKDLGSKYFWPFYQYRDLSETEFEKLYNNFNGHTALMTLAYNGVEWLYDNNLHNVLHNTTETTRTIWKRIEFLIDQLSEKELKVMALFTLIKAPINAASLFDILENFFRISEGELNDLLFSLRKKLLLGFHNQLLSINPYIREICFTYIKRYKHQLIHSIEQLPFMHENGMIPVYDEIRQASEKGDYKLFYSLLKKQRQKGHFNYVHSIIEEIAITDPIINKVGLMNEKAIAFKMEGKWNEAIEILKEAYALEPKNVKIINELAINYKNIGDEPEAIKYLEKGVALENLPSFTELALIHKKNGQIELAIKILKEAVVLKNVPSFTELAKIYWEKGETLVAIEILCEALELDALDQINIDLLGKIYTKMGEKDKAETTYELGLKCNRYKYEVKIKELKN